MTQEEKQLLLKDLCARYPYKIICKLSAYGAEITEQLELGGLGQFMYGRIDVKPYLRPMSSMTEEERNEYHLLCTVAGTYGHYPTVPAIDYLYSIHIDVHHLIPKGLALEAPEEMYKMEE